MSQVALICSYSNMEVRQIVCRVSEGFAVTCLQHKFNAESSTRLVALLLGLCIVCIRMCSWVHSSVSVTNTDINTENQLHRNSIGEFLLHSNWREARLDDRFTLTPSGESACIDVKVILLPVSLLVRVLSVNCAVTSSYPRVI